MADKEAEFYGNCFAYFRKPHVIQAVSDFLSSDFQLSVTFNFELDKVTNVYIMVEII